MKNAMEARSSSWFPLTQQPKKGLRFIPTDTKPVQSSHRPAQTPRTISSKAAFQKQGRESAFRINDFTSCTVARSQGIIEC
ncbi:hypothetical protein MHYP_G00228010 [Metynnis hypsauchen]